jgi:hypothetical protein
LHESDINNKVQQQRLEVALRWLSSTDTLKATEYLKKRANRPKYDKLKGAKVYFKGMSKFLITNSGGLNGLYVELAIQIIDTSSINEINRSELNFLKKYLYFVYLHVKRN